MRLDALIELMDLSENGLQRFATSCGRALKETGRCSRQERRASGVCALSNMIRSFADFSAKPTGDLAKSRIGS
jgi:hypothetical protein